MCRHQSDYSDGVCHGVYVIREEEKREKSNNRLMTAGQNQSLKNN